MKRILRRKSSPPITAEMAAAFKRMSAEGLYQHQIAAEYGVNPGRVNDVLKGRRFGDTPAVNSDQLPFDFG